MDELNPREVEPFRERVGPRVEIGGTRILGDHRARAIHRCRNRPRMNLLKYLPFEKGVQYAA